MRKATRRRWQADPLASSRLLDRARPFDPGDTTEQHIKTRAAFERLENGTADNDDFDRVAMALNLAKIRALEIDRALADLLEVGQEAMTAVRKRHDKWAKWEVLPAERSATCRKPFDWGDKQTKPHIDHCHGTGKVRGILCNRCNTVLGLVADDKTILAALVGYLE